MGPNSVAGINRNRGINENFAREILELHTLGVRTGYTQDDVIRFANTLTGWTFIGTGVPEHGGEFVFFERYHEPGEQIVLGKRYPDTGFAQGRAVLADLARHPATARHIAEKFARHFVTDDPPPQLINRLKTSFSDSDGDLKQLARTLILADELWTPARTKLKRPGEWHIAALRLTGSHGMPRASWPARRCLASRGGGRPHQMAFPTIRRLGSTGSPSASTLPVILPLALATGSIQKRSSTKGLARWPRQHTRGG